MSFILDALKKSETDRQRQNGPALFEVRTPPPRSGLPLWAMGLAVLLAVNLVIVAWVLLRRPAPAEAAPAQVASQQAPAVAYPGNNPAPAQAYPGQGPQTYQGAGGGQNVQAYQASASGASQGAPQSQVMPSPPPATVPVAGTAPTSPLGQTAGMTQPQPGYPAPGTPLSAPGSALSAGGNGVPVGQADATGEKLNPDDYAPATDAPSAAAFGSHVSRNTASGVPLYQDAALAPGAHIPELRLDLHVFAAKPQERFVMINMHKLHEGDTLPEGVHVESITPEGAVLSSNGTRFLLPHD